jgi:predicted DCC family thiol-disulfide oxidoreductase YuxK
VQSVILYDADCGFCRWSVARILRRDRNGDFRAVALQSPEADRLLPGMDEERRLSSWHVVTPEGRVYSAGAGLVPILPLYPGGKQLQAFVRAFPWVAEGGYRLVAGNRGFLGRILRRRLSERDALDPTTPHGGHLERDV